MNIHNINENFDFSNISLVEPVRIQGGAYFAYIRNNNNEFYINTPKSSTKNGIVRSGKRAYCDLLYSDTDVNIINWVIELEKTLKQKLFEKAPYWFQNDMDLDDIDYFFNSPLRSFRTNKYLLRCFVNENKKFANKNKLQIFDENENLRTETDIVDSSILTILHIKGVRFTSNSFHLEMELKQIMILEDKHVFNNCLIKTNTTPNVNTSNIDTMSDVSNNGLSNEDDLGNNVIKQELVSLEVIENEKIPENIESPININDNEVNIINQSNIKHISEANEIPNTLEETDETNNNVEYSGDNAVNEVIDEIINEVDTQYDNTKGDSTESDHEVDEEDIDNQEVGILESNQAENEIKQEYLGKSNSVTIKDSLEEFSIDINQLDDEPLKLKKPNEVFYEIYREARRKAKMAKKAAMIAILEAKNIKNTYMLDDIEDSSDEEFDIETLDEEF